MEMAQIKSYLQQQSQQHGAIKTLCTQHGLNYIHVWRFATGRVKKLNHDDGVKLGEVLKGIANA